jgi:hypothetical protein
MLSMFALQHGSIKAHSILGLHLNKLSVTPIRSASTVATLCLIGFKAATCLVDLPD